MWQWGTGPPQARLLRLTQQLASYAEIERLLCSRLNLHPGVCCGRAAVAAAAPLWDAQDRCGFFDRPRYAYQGMSHVLATRQRYMYHLHTYLLLPSGVTVRHERSHDWRMCACFPSPVSQALPWVRCSVLRSPAAPCSLGASEWQTGWPCSSLGRWVASLHPAPIHGFMFAHACHLQM